MRLAEARARRSVILRDSSFKPTDVKGSNDGPCERALNTASRSQVRTEGGLGGCSLLALLRKLTTMAFLPIDCPSFGEQNVAMAATYTFSVDGNDPLSSLYGVHANSQICNGLTRGENALFVRMYAFLLNEHPTHKHLSN